jgi:hypothetical protein
MSSTVWLFGGRDSSAARVSNELRIYDTCGSRSWTVPTVTGTPPAGRWGASTTLVPGRSGVPPAIYVYGGIDGSDERLADIRRLAITGDTFARWEDVTTIDSVVPPGRSGHLMFHDTPRTRLLLMGGENRNDVWELLLR